MRKTYLTTLLLLVIGIGAFVTNHANAGGGLTANVITQVAFNSGGFYIYADSWNNPNGCDNTAAVVLLSSDTNYDKAYALLLSAYMSGKTVIGFSDGCTTFNRWGQCKLIS